MNALQFCHREAVTISIIKKFCKFLEELNYVKLLNTSYFPFFRKFSTLLATGEVRNHVMRSVHRNNFDVWIQSA